MRAEESGRTDGLAGQDVAGAQCRQGAERDRERSEQGKKNAVDIQYKAMLKPPV